MALSISATDRARLELSGRGGEGRGGEGEGRGGGGEGRGGEGRGVQHYIACDIKSNDII